MFIQRRLFKFTDLVQNTEEVLYLIAALVAAWLEVKQKKNNEKKSFHIGHV